MVIGIHDKKYDGNILSNNHGMNLSTSTPTHNPLSLSLSLSLSRAGRIIVNLRDTRDTSEEVRSIFESNFGTLSSRYEK